MNYFDNMHFVYYADNPEYRGVVSNRFFDYYGLQYTHSGTLLFEGERYRGSHWFLTVPGRSYSYRAPAGESRHHCYICVSGPRVEEMLRHQLLLNTERPVPVSKPDQVLWRIQNIIGSLDTPGYLNYAKAAHQFEGLLLFLLEDFNCRYNINAKVEPQMRKLTMEIREHPELEWNFKVIAGEMKLSESYFRSCFKQMTTYAPTQFLIECRLNRAVGMLRDKQLTIGEIARRCGFSDSFYFSRIFKKHRGVSPQRYFSEL